VSTFRKFDVSVVVEVVDPATDAERDLDQEVIPPLIRAAAVTQARQVLERWERGDRQFLSIHVVEVP
jgi:hypothetical protein